MRSVLGRGSESSPGRKETGSASGSVIAFSWTGAVIGSTALPALVGNRRFSFRSSSGFWPALMTSCRAFDSALSKLRLPVGSAASGWGLRETANMVRRASSTVWAKVLRGSVTRAEADKRRGAEYDAAKWVVVPVFCAERSGVADSSLGPGGVLPSGGTSGGRFSGTRRRQFCRAAECRCSDPRRGLRRRIALGLARDADPKSLDHLLVAAASAVERLGCRETDAFIRVLAERVDQGFLGFGPSGAIDSSQILDGGDSSLGVRLTGLDLRRRRGRAARLLLQRRDL